MDDASCAVCRPLAQILLLHFSELITQFPAEFHSARPNSKLKLSKAYVGSHAIQQTNW